jgi:hypothetical protein
LLGRWRPIVILIGRISGLAPKALRIGVAAALHQAPRFLFLLLAMLPINLPHMLRMQRLKFLFFHKTD